MSPSVLLLIPVLLGLFACGLIFLKPRIRGVVPKPAVFLAVLAFLVFFVWLSLGSLGQDAFPSVAAPWLGFAVGLFAAAYVLALGYVYGDAARRGMPPVSWTLLAFFVPNLVGFLLYLLLRKPFLAPCGQCGQGVRQGLAFCPHCGQPQERPVDFAVSRSSS
jgi:hypothetical protein